MKILITGVAGFIGFSLTKYLQKNISNTKIIGVDNLNDYYSLKLKKKRISNLSKKNFIFLKLDICDKTRLNSIFLKYKPEIVINLAAQAGVRYSVDYPSKYIDSNINGFFNILSLCKEYKAKKLIYASSSSVYGDNKAFPIKETINIFPKNLYGLSKKFNEEVSEIFSNFYNLQLIGLRFFTVYGEWGRPDMFFFKYLISSVKKNIFYLNNYGNHFRDFTYIDDVTKIIFKLIKKKQKKNHLIFNICSGKSHHLSNIMSELNKYVKKPNIIKRGLQSADIFKTHGNNIKIKKYLNIKKFINIKIGIKNTCLWYLKNKLLF
jgi:UDP-glucuronate 4-epimerase